MADGPAGMETIGYLFSAKDLASGTAVKAEKTIEAAAEGVENTLLGLATAAEDISLQIGASFDGVEDSVVGMQAATQAVTGKAMKDAELFQKGAAAQMQALAEAGFKSLSDFTAVERAAFGTEFKKDVEEAVGAFGAQIDTMTQKVKEFSNLPPMLKTALASVPLEEQAEAVRMFYEALNGIPAVAGAVAVSLDKMEAALDQNQVTLKNVALWVGKGAKASFFGVLATGADIAVKPIAALATTLGSAADSFQAFLNSKTKLKDVGNLFAVLKVKASSAAVAIKDGVRAFFGFSDPKGMKGIKDFEKEFGALHKSGGIGGALLGPLAPVLKLLQPLIDLVEEALQPAIETFGMLVKNAFAPFSFLVDTIMQSLGPVIQKVIGPFASVMELIAAQVGVVLQGLMDTSGAAGGMAQLVPAFTKVAAVVGDLATEVLPILMEVGGTLFDALMEVLPDLVDLVAELVKAFAPLLVGLLKIGAAIVKYVEGPLLVATIKMIVGLVKAAVPYIAEFARAFQIGAEKLVVKIKNFFGHFKENATIFYEDYLKPAIDWITGIPSWISDMASGAVASVGSLFTAIGNVVSRGWTAITTLLSMGWRTITDLFNFDSVTSGIGTAFSVLLDTLSAPLRGLVEFVDDALLGPLNKILTSPLPLIGQIGALLGIGSIASPKIPGLAEGGITTGPTIAQIGEAGPEAVIPLRPEAIERIIAPMFPKMEMPGLREMVGILSEINAALHGTLKVASADDGMGGARGRGDDGDVFAAPGLSGAGGW